MIGLDNIIGGIIRILLAIDKENKRQQEEESQQ